MYAICKVFYYRQNPNNGKRTSKMFSFPNGAPSRGHNHNVGDCRYHPVVDKSFDYRSRQIANWFAINGFAPSY